jgi:aromatic-L-amino-acid decarboxylase
MHDQPGAGAGAGGDGDGLRRGAAAVAELIVRHLQEVPDRPVFRPVPPEVVGLLREAPLPSSGQSLESVLERFTALVEPYPFGNGHPRFFGWVNSPPLPAAVLATGLAAAMNPSVAGGNHAAVHVEHEVLRWSRELLGLPASFTGLMTSGTSTSVLIALAAARRRACAAADWDVRVRGLQPDGADRPPRLAVYASAQAHSCHTKAIEALGLGSQNLREVAVDEALRMRPDELDRLIAEDVAEGVVPMAVIATLGTVNTGAIDPLGPLADVAQAHGCWLHVDGAYGAPAVLLPEHADLRAALGRADSIAFDGHKWLYVPVDAGVLLLREPAAARDAWSLVPAYLRSDQDEAGVHGPPWFSEFGLEQTRPFRALPLWVALQNVGRDGYRQLIERDVAHARLLAALVRAQPSMELFEPQGLSIVCFRVVPGGPGDGKRQDERQDERGEQEADRLNQRLLSAVQLGGRAFLSSTVLAGRFWLRACLVNPRTTDADVHELVATVLDAVRAARAADHAGGSA